MLIEKRYIYCLKHPITGEIRYIGKTKNPKDRYKKHLSSYKLVRNKKNKQYVSRWINKLKYENLEPVMEILIECDRENVNTCEINFIAHYKQFCKLTNLTIGGEGVEHSEEERKRISKRMLGNKYNIGRKHSDETKLKHSISKKGDLNPKRKNMKKVLQYDIGGNFIKEWLSGEDAAKELNISSSGINRCCNKKKNYYSSGGFIWKYKKEMEVINVL